MSYLPSMKILPLLLLPIASLRLAGNAQTPGANDKAWVTRSDSFTNKLIDLDKKYSPEFGSREGLAIYDKEIAVPTMANALAYRKEEESLAASFTQALTVEKQPQVAQDLDILLTHLKQEFRRQDFELQHEVPFFNAATTIYDGLDILLDDQTPAVRHAAAVIRIRKYAGLENGYRPITEILKERITGQIARGDMIFPSKQKIEVQLSRNTTVMNGIPELCKKFRLTGWEKPFAVLRQQVADYDQWIRDHVLTRARTDFRLPPEEYALALDEYGITIPPAELAGMAHAAFTDLQQQMAPIAAQIAQNRHWASSDYRDVMRELKKEQLHGDSILIVYEQHLKDIEAIIREHQIVTLPNRPAKIRLATAAESAQQPAPHMVPPPFLNNTGQHGVFVLPLNMPPQPGQSSDDKDKYDDFTFDAASWTIIAHECRPGHELQFDKMVEEGVSKARALYAFNSTNVEGWGLYSENLILPYMPREGQLVSLDYRMLRAARAFLDPELQAGKVTQQQALAVLTNDVVCSPAFARSEVERYSVRAPGQANSYFFGYTKLIQLRKDVQAAMGDRFEPLVFHDFILSQGLLPPALIREAVMKEFVK
jgi:hypothetical protein